MLRRLFELADPLRDRGRRGNMSPEQALGRRGEDVAQRFLQRLGMTVVARNYRMASGAGEIDLVAREDDTLVIVEVKARQSDEYGAPDRAIGAEKQSSVIRAAREYARHADVPWDKVRFDIVSVVFSSPPSIAHFRDIFHTRQPI